MDRPQVKKQIAQDAIETRAEVTKFSQRMIDRWTPLIQKMMAAKDQ
jgi:hypothetical protein